MRIYDENKIENLKSVTCNGCQKQLMVKKGILIEECIHIKKTFGYFSDRDGTTESFDLCQECYEKIVKGLAIPVDRQDNTEFL